MKGKVKGAVALAVALTAAAFCAQAQQPPVSLTFTDSDGNISHPEGETAIAAFSLSAPTQDALIVRYTVENGTADASDYVAGSGMVTVPAGSMAGEIRIPIIDDEDIESPREIFHIDLVSSDGYILGSRPRLTVTIQEGICDRSDRLIVWLLDLNHADCALETPQNSDFSLAAESFLLAESLKERINRQEERGNFVGLGNFKEKDFSGFTNLQQLLLNGVELTMLWPKQFSGLDNLRFLWLHDNRLTSLPQNVFSDLDHFLVRSLTLNNNRLTSLPQNIFSSFSGRRFFDSLRLDNNRLTTLPANVFSGLIALESLRLNGNRLTTLPANVFSGLTDLRRLRLNDNRLRVLPPGIFSGLSNSLTRLHLHNNPGAPFELTLHLEPADEAQDLATVLSSDNSVQVRLALPTGAPYSLNVNLEASGVNLSADQVTISNGMTQSAPFTVTRDGDATSFRISFTALRRSSGDYNGFGFVGVPVVYTPGGTGPEISEIRFASAPQISGFYRLQLRETINVDVIFDKDLTVTIPEGGAPPALELQIGDSTRTATYVPHRSVGDVLSFSYTLMADDLDEDGVSVADESSLQLNGSTVTDVFDRPADVTLPASLLAGLPEYEVRLTTFLSFADFDGRIFSSEGSTVDAVFNLDLPMPETLTVHYAVTDGSADADDYAPVSGMVEVPAGETAGTIQIPIIDDEDVEPPREVFNLRLVSSPDYTLGMTANVEVVIREGVCDRTPEVIEHIQEITQVEGVSLPCFAIDSDHLDGIDSLALSGQLGDVTTLKSKDFSGLTGLRQLFMSNNQLTELPRGLFDGFHGDFFRLQILGNRLTTLPPGMFSGLTGLRTVLLHDNPGAPFRLALRLESANETALSEAFMRSAPVPVRLTLAEGAPYSLEVRFDEVSGVTLSASPVTISTGATQSEEFTVTRDGGATSFRISFAELSPPNDCQSGHQHEGQCYTGIEVVGSPIVYSQDGTGPQVSAVQFTSVPLAPNTYSAGVRETIDVDVIFDRGLIITSDEVSSPTLLLEIGDNTRTATYVPHRSVGDVLSFSYTLMADDLDEDGVSVADESSLQLNGSTITDIFDRAADLTLEPRFLADRPGHKVAERVIVVTFTDANRFIQIPEGQTIDAELSLSVPPRETLVVHYTVTEGTADANDYDAGSGTVEVPADSMTGVIRIPIIDDEDIEPPREQFSLDLDLSGDYVLGDRPRLSLQINEGVCDRTPGVRDSIRMSKGCEAVNSGDVDRIDGLSLSGGLGDVTTLKSKDFSGLRGLRRLFMSDNQLTELPQGLFNGFHRDFFRLNINGNRLRRLPPGMFSGLTGLLTVHLHDNPGAPFRLLLRLESANETALSALPMDAPAPVRLTLAEGAPYPLEVHFDEVSGVTLSASPVTISTGATQSEEFTVTRTSQSFSIGFAELPPSPNNCQSSHQHEGQCYTGIEVAGSSIVYRPGETGPQVSTVQFTSVPQNPPTYSAEMRETIDVEVVFDKGLIITSDEATSPTLALRVGGNTRTATYAPHRSGGDVLSFSYTLMANDLDEDGVSVADGALQLNGSTITDVFGRGADLTLEPRFLADRPGHKVAERVIVVTFTDADRFIQLPEGSTINAEFSLSVPPRETLVVHYTVTEGTADANDYVAGSGTVEVPAGSMTSVIRIPIIDDEDIEPPREQFSLDLDLSGDYLLGDQPGLRLQINEGVCDRTPQVRDRLLQAISGANKCEDPDSDSLSGITPRLTFSDGFLGDVTTLKSKDFSGLTNLRELFMAGNRLTELPQGLFDDFPSHFDRLGIDRNRLRVLPPGIFSGLTGLRAVHLFDNPGAPFTLALRLESADETALSEAFMRFAPVPVRLTLAEGAPYLLEVRFDEISGVTLSASSVTISTGATQSETFRVTRENGATSFRISFAELPPPTTCPGSYKFNGQCYTGIEVEVIGSPIVYSQDGTGPQVSAVQFTSVPQSPPTYSAEMEETIDVDVVFDRGVIVTSSLTPYGTTSPVLVLQVGTNRRTATYVPGRSGGDVLSFSYTLSEDERDEDGVSVADESSLRPNGSTVTDVFGRAADVTLAARFLADNPGHKVAERVIPLRFTDPDRTIHSREGGSAVAEFAFGATLRETLVVHYTVTEDTADADDYDAGSGRVEVPAGSMTGEIRIPVHDDEDIEPVRDRFGIELIPGFGYVLSPEDRARLTAVIGEGVCDRTPEVRDFIQGNLNSCHDVNNGRMNSFTSVALSGLLGDVTTLKSKDFSGFSRLNRLFISNNQLTELPQGLFDGFRSIFFRMHIIGNRLTALPPGMFSGLTGLLTVLLHDNPGAPFRLALHLESANETPLSEAFLTSAPVPVRLTVVEGAPYPLEVHFDEVSGVTLSDNPVMIPTGATQSEEFTMTRTSESFSIGFAELPPPNNCQSSHRHEGQCYTGIEVVGAPIVYAPDGTGPQVSAVQFTSVPQDPSAYSAESGETIDVNVVFDREVIVTFDRATSPTLALEIGDNTRTATYVPGRSGGDVLSFSYTLSENDFDENGVSVADESSLQPNGSTITDVFDRAADLTLESRFLADRPGHKVAPRIIELWFTDSDGEIYLPEGAMEDTEFSLSSSLQRTLAVHYTATESLADEYDVGSGTVEVPAGDTAGTIRIVILNDDDIEPPRESFDIELVPGFGYKPISGGGARTRLRIIMQDGICDRTPQAWRSILAAVRARFGSGVNNNCIAVRNDHLDDVTSLGLSRDPGDVTTLKSKDFSGLTNLRQLDMSDHQLTELPQGLFDSFRSRFFRLNINGNQLEALPPGMFSGLTGLQTVHLFDNPGVPFRLVLRLESAGETALSEALLMFNVPVPVRLTLAEGAPYPLEVHFEVSGVTLSDNPVMISAGATQSEEFIVTSNSVPFSIRFAELAPPNDCESDDQHEGQCFTGFEIVGSSVFYPQDGAGPQVSTIQFTSVPSPDTYSAEARETIEVDVIFDRGLVVTFDEAASPTLALQIGENRRTATYVPGRSVGDVLSFSYTLSEDDLDEDGVSVADSGLQLEGSTVTDIFGQDANVILAERFLADRPGHKVAETLVFLAFTGGNIGLREGQTTVVEAEFELSETPQETRVVRYTVTAGSATADDYHDLGGGRVEVPAGSTTGAILISIIDDEDVERTDGERFYINLVDYIGGGYAVRGGSRLRVTIHEGVCDRTPQVHAEIVREISMRGFRSPRDCWEIIPEHLWRWLYRLDLRGEQLDSRGDERITTLKREDFAGVSFRGSTYLERVYLSDNMLTTLPPGLLSGLTDLMELRLQNNDLTTLPATIFRSLRSLRELRLDGNQLEALPPGLFSDLRSLQELRLDGNQLEALPPGLFSGLRSLRELRLNDNQLEALPPDIFTGLSQSGLEVLHLHGNAVTLASTLRLALDSETQDLSSALSMFDPVPFRLTSLEGAPYPLQVRLMASGAALSTDTVTISTGATRSDMFTVTRNRGESRIEIDFDQLPSLPNDCADDDKHQGQCFTGFEITGEPLVYVQGGTGPQVSTIQFTSVPQNPPTYSAESREMIHVSVIFDRELIFIHEVPGGASPTLVLQIGGSARTATYASGRSGGDVLGLSYRLSGNDLDKDGISIARDGLRLNDMRLIDILGRPAELTLADHLLGPHPGHRVAPRVVSVSFVESEIDVAENENRDLLINIEASPSPQVGILVPFVVIEDSADADDYSPFVQEVGMPAGTSQAFFSVIVRDDEDIDLPRERFYIELVPSFGYSVERASSRVTINILEGVCDRTGRVEFNLRIRGGVRIPCVDVLSEDLNAFETLDLRSQGMKTLKSKDFLGLSRLTQLLLSNNQLTELPQGLFDGFPGDFFRLTIAGNQLEGLPPGIFSGLSGLNTLHLHDNPVAPFRLVLRLESANETPLSEALLTPATPTFDPVPVRLTLAEGAPYPLEVHFDEVSGVTLSPAGPVTISAGSTQSEPFTVTRDDGATSFRISFAELAPPPNDCDSSHQHEGQCFTGFGITGEPIAYSQGGTGPQVSTIRFTSVPSRPNIYRTELGETIEVDVVFDRGLIVTSAASTSPTLALQIGGNVRTATYVPHRNVGNALSFRYRLTEDDIDENGVSIAAGGLRLHDTTYSDVFGFPADATLEPRFLADHPGHRVVWRIASVSFTESEIEVVEGQTVVVGINLSSSLRRALVIPYTVTNDSADAGDHDAGSGTVTMPSGSTTGAIEILIRDDEDVDQLRERFYLDLVDSDSYDLGATRRLTVDIREGICDRTLQVRTVILARLAGVNSCDAVVGGDLSGMTGTLDISSTMVSNLKEGDFSGLASLRNLYLHKNQLSTLPASIFSGLGQLLALRLNNNRLSTLPASVFSGLGQLQDLLYLNNNRLSTLPPSVFSGLGQLQDLHLNNNQLSMLPASVFSGLDQLQNLKLERNRLGAGDAGGPLSGTLPANLFNGLGNLRTLGLHYNQLSVLPATIFSGLNSLRTMDLGFNRLTRLPDGIFSDHGSLQRLFLANNQLEDLPDEVFFDFEDLTDLNVAGNRLTGFPPGAFAGYDEMRRLRLEDNQLSTLPPGVFSGLTKLDRLDLKRNSLTELPAGVFSGLSSLTVFHLGGNPAGDFEFRLRLELDDGVQASALTSSPIPLRATLREGAPYSLTLEIEASNGELSSTEMMLAAGSTQSESVTLTPHPGASSVTVEFTSPLPSRPSNCDGFEREGGLCFSGFDIVFGAPLALGGAPPVVSRAEIISTPFQDDTTYIGGDPGEEIVVEIVFDRAVEVLQAENGNWPTLALEIGRRTRLAAYDENRSSGTNLVFRYKPQGGDDDNDGISVLADALSLNGARILDRGAPVPLDLGAHAIENDPDHKVENTEAICDRTPQVQTAILDQLAGIGSCADVVNQDLAGLTGTMDLSSQGITIFKEGDFSGLVNLQNLYLNHNQLSTLPASVFDGLNQLQELRLQNNPLRSLPRGVFSSLARLNWLNLSDTRLAGLPAGVFSGLSSLRMLHVSGSPGGDFSLRLRLELPDDAEARLAAVSPVPLWATLHEGAPYPLNLGIQVSGGELSPAEIMLAAGSTQSGSVTLTPHSNARSVTVQFISPSPPLECVPERWISGRCFSGFEIVVDPPLVLSVGLPIVTIANQPLTVMVEEGETAEITVQADRLLQAALTIGYTIGMDDNAGTADADGDDYTAAAGMVTIGAGETTATIEIGIADDDDAEPTREVFRVTLSSGASYDLGSSDQTLATVEIEEGVCDRTRAVEEAIVTAAAGADNCADVNDAILDRIDSLTLAGAFTPQASDFSGLDALRELRFDNTNVVGSLPADVFSGLGALRELRFDNANVGSLPADVFSGLGDTLRVLNMRSATLGALPAGIFSGLMLDYLGLPETAALPFRFMVVDESSSPSSVSLRVVSAPGAPFGLSVDLSPVNATLLPSSVSLPAGATRSDTFTVTRDSDVGVAVVRFAAVPTTVRESVRFDVEFDVEDEFAMGATTPVDMTIDSMPAGEFYEAGETIRVEVTFGGDIHVSDSAGPMLALEIGDETRMARLVETEPAALIFEYQVIADDYDTDGVSIRPDALTPGGAAITDDSGGRARLELGAHARMNDAAHKVAGRQLSLALDLQAENIALGSFSPVVLTLAGADLPAGDDVAVSLGLDASRLVAPPVVMIERALSSTRVRVFARVDAALGPSVLTASVAPDVQASIPALISSTELSVRIVPRAFNLSFEPSMVEPIAGGPPVQTTLRLTEREGAVGADEEIVVALTRSMGINVTSESGVPLTMVALRRGVTTTRILVIADLNAEHGFDRFLTASASALPANTRIDEGRLTVSVQQREISVLFEPPGIRLVRGGMAEETTSRTVILKTEPELQGAEEMVVNLSATGDLAVISMEPITFSPMRNTAAVSVEASGPNSGEVSATVDMAASSLGNAMVTPQPLAVEVVRRVGLSLKGYDDSDAVVITVGESTDVTVRTDPLLERDEEVTVTLRVDSGLMIDGANQLVLTGAAQSATVRIRAVVPELNLTEGVSVSGVSGNVEISGGASLQVVTRSAAGVAAALTPSLVEVQQGGSTMLRVTTNPQLAPGQSVSLTLTIEPGDGDLSFAGDSFITTLELVGGQLPAVDVAVSVSPDAAIGSAFDVVLELIGSEGVEAAIGGQARTALTVTTPQVTVGFTPEGGAAGDELALNLGTSKAVSLNLTDFTLSGGQTAAFEVSVVGDGLTLQGGVQSREVSLTASGMTAEVTVSASAEAQSVGRLEVRAVGGVELAGGVRAMVLPIEVLQPVSLRFVPELVLIERGRSTEFMVMTTEELVADRAATVLLSVPGDGFRFAGGQAQHEVALRAGEAMTTVAVSATAEIGSTVAVSVNVEATAGVVLGSLPSLELRATTPRVAVVFDADDVVLTEAVLTIDAATEVVVRLRDDHGLQADRNAVLGLSVQGDGLEVTPQEVTLTEENGFAATVTISATQPGVSGVLIVTAVSGVRLLEEATLPVQVRRQFSLSFDPSEVELIAGGLPVQTTLVLTEDAGSLEPGEEVEVTLTPSMGINVRSASGELLTTVTLRKDVADATTQIRVSAGLDADYTRPGSLRASASADNTLLDEGRLAVSVGQRGISVLFEPSAIRLVRGGTAAMTVLLKTEPELQGAEEMVVNLSATDGLTVTPTALITLSSMRNTASISVEASGPNSGAVFATVDMAASSLGNAMVTPRPPQPLTVEVVRLVELSLKGYGDSDAVVITVGESTDVTVRTDPLLERDEAVTVTLTVASGLGLDGATRLVLTEANQSATVRIRALEPGLTLPEGVSVSGVSGNVEIPGGASLQVETEDAAEVAAALTPSSVEVQQGDGTTLGVTTAPRLGQGQSVSLTLMIEPDDGGLSFAGGSFITTVELVGGQSPAAEVAVSVSPDAPIESVFDVVLALTGNVGVEAVIGGQARTAVTVTTPRVNVSLTPEGGAAGDEVVLNLRESKAVSLSLPGFSLLGGQTATFEVSAVGEGLTVQDGEVSLTATDMTAEVMVSASAEAQSAGRLEVRAVGGVELAGGVRAAVLPIKVFQTVSLGFVPELVLIERDRSAEFVVTTTEALVADRAVTVALSVQGDGFRFAGDNAQHQVVLRAGEAMKTVEVSATAEIGSTVAVSVNVDATAGVVLGSLPSLELRATTPRVAVVFDADDVVLTEAVLTIDAATEVVVRLRDDHGLQADRNAVLGLSVQGDGLEVTPQEVTLTEENGFAATVTISATQPGVSGVLTVTAVSGVRLLEETTLPVQVRRQFSLSFEPETVALTTGGSPVPATLVLTEEAGSLAPGEEIVVTLTPSMGINVTSASGAPVTTVTLRKDVADATARATTRIGVSARLDADHTTLGFLRASASADNARVGGARLAASVRRREISVLFEPPGIRLVHGGSADMTSRTVTLKTEPELQGAEEVSVILSATGDLTVRPAAAVVLSSMRNTATVNIEASGLNSGEVSATLDVAGSSLGNAAVTTMQPLTVEIVRGVRLSLKGPGDSDVVSIVAGKSADVTVATEPLLQADESVTVTLNVASGLMLEGASLALVGGNRLVLTGMDRSATVRISASVPELDLPAGASASGVGANVAVIGDASLRVITSAAVEVAATFRPSEVKIQQGTSTMLRVTTDPQLGQGQSVLLTLTIEPDDGDLSFAGSSVITTVELVGARSEDVEVSASPDAAIGSTFKVVLTSIGSEGVEATIGEQATATVTVTTPRVTVDLTPEGGGDVLELNLGASKAVSLSLPGFTLRGGQTATFEVSVVGAGLTLEGGVDDGKTLRVSLDAAKMTAEVTVSASAEAEPGPVGRLEVRAIGGVELLGATPVRLPITVLESTGVRLRIKVFLEGALE